MRTKIIYEDESVLVCYKPAGLATQTARVGQQDMVSELKNYLNRKSDGTQRAGSGRAAQPACGGVQTAHGGVRSARVGVQSARVGVQPARVAVQPARKGAPYLGVVHRLDQPVEGLLVFAKTSQAAAKLTAQLSQGDLNKQYYAAVCGQPAGESGELVDYLIKDSATSGAVVVTSCRQEYPEAKKAVLQYQVKRNLFTEEPAAVLDIHIDTGRFHQIRAQMANAGLPLLGDSKYGDDRAKQMSQKLMVRNVALCAYKIIFRHPVTGEQKCFSIEPEGKIFNM